MYARKATESRKGKEAGSSQKRGGPGEGKKTRKSDHKRKMCSCKKG